MDLHNDDLNRDDLNRDELRRELRATDEAHRASLGVWRRALHRAFASPDVSHEAKARFVGLSDPTRRRFLAVGGATVAGAAVLAACGTGSGGQVAHTGTQPVTPSTSVPPQPPSVSEPLTETQADQSILQTATSLELLLVAFYDDATTKGWLTSQPAIDTIKRFRDQHNDHAEALKAATVSSGAKAYDKPNASLQKTLIDPTVATLHSSTGTTEASWLTFCQRLENVAASTYVADAATLGSAKLRQAAMGIGAVEARHHVVLANLLAAGAPTGWVPFAVQPMTDAIGSEAAIGGAAS